MIEIYPLYGNEEMVELLEAWDRGEGEGELD